MQKNINVILSLVNMSQKNQQYKLVKNLAEMNALFKNKPITFNVEKKSYALIYNPTKEEIQIQEQTFFSVTIATFKKSTTIEKILQTFGNL